MAQQFLKKKFSFRGLFLRFFAIVFFSLSVTVNVYAADSTDTKIKSLHDFYNHIVSLPFKVPNQNQNTNSESKNIPPQTNILTQVTAIAGQATAIAGQANNLSDVIFKSFADYYDSYTSGLASLLYPEKNISLTKVTPAPSKTEPKALAMKLPAVVSNTKTAPLNSTSPRPSPYQGEGGKQIVYIPIPGPQGPKGDKGDKGDSVTQMISSSNNPVAYMPVGITIPNPSANFTGGEYASIANLTSNLFTNNTSNINTLNVTTNSTIGGALSVTGATTLGGNLNVTGTITGSITGAMNPALTNGSVFFQDTAGISQDNANFFYDKVNHRLGLGTVAPASVLHVSGAGAGLIRIQNTNTNGRAWGIETVDTGAGANGTFEIVDRTLNARRALFLANGAVSMGPSIGNDVGGSDFNIDSTGNVAIGALSPGSAKLYVAGNVGIGTTNPAQRLNVSGGKFQVDNSDFADFYLVGTGQTANNKIWSLQQNGLTFVGRVVNDAENSAATWLTVTRSGAFINSVGLFAGGAERLRVDQGGNVGIGSTTPTELLNVVGASGQIRAQVESGTAQVALVADSTGNGYVGTRSAHPLGLLAGGNIKVTVTTAGNVGIGTTAPTQILTLNKIAGSTHTVVEYQVGGTTYSYMGVANAANGIVSGSALGDAVFRSQGGNFLFSTDSGATANFYIKNGGNVGIGTTGPGYKLDVSGAGAAATVRAISTSGGFTGFRAEAPASAWSEFKATDGTVTGVFGQNGTLAYAGATSNHDFQLLANNSVAMTIKTTGNVGIGTTAPGALFNISATGSNTEEFRITQTTANTGYYMRLTDGTNNNIIGQENNSGTGVFGSGIANAFVIGTQQAKAIAFHTNNVATPRMVIDSTGNVGIGTTAPNYALTLAGVADPSIALTSVNNTNPQGLIRWQLSGQTLKWYIGAHQYLSNDFEIGDASAARLVVQATSGNVGIGTTAPAALLHTYTTGAGNVLLSRFQVGSVANAYLELVANNNASQLRVDQFGGFALSTGATPGTFGTTRLGIDNSGNLSVNSGQFYVQQSSGNVGIGTTAPTAKLHVVNSSSSEIMAESTSNGNASLILKTGGNSWQQLIVGGSADLSFFNNAYRMTLASGGNVGIGTTAPAQLLHLSSSQPDLVITQTSTANYGRLVFRENATEKGGITWIGTTYSDATRQSSLEVSGNTGFIGFRTNNGGDAERMRITNTGNLGINTTAPASKLHIHGTVPYGQARFTPSSATGESSIGFYDDVAGTDANDAWSVGQGSWGQTGKFVIGNENNGAGGNVRLVIQKDGNVGIGTTTPRGKLSFGIAGAVSTVDTIRLYDDGVNDWYSVGTNSVAPELRITAGTSGRVTFFTGTSGGTEKVRIDTAGNVGIGTTAPANALDIGSTQGIRIASGTPTNTTAALYNNGGVLTWNGSAVSAGAPAFSSITGGTNTAAAMVVGTGSSLTYQGGAATSGSINANLYKGNSLVAVGDGGTGTSNGSITGTGALTYAAGGVNQNVTLTPSGTGYTLLNGNVGIGTSTPAALLTLEGSGAINGGLNAGLNIRSTNASGLSLFRFTTSDNVSFDFGKNGPSNQGGSVYFWAGSNIPIAFGNNNTARLSIDTTGGISMGTYAAAGGGSSPANGLVVSGNVGVGVSAPGAKLSVSGGAGIGSSYSGTAVSDGNMIIQGNVGVGTVTPNAKLSLWNNIATGFLDNYSEYQILLYDSATPSSSVGIGVKSNTMVFNSGSGAFSFDRGGSVTAMAIDLAGNVGIGTTGPAQKLEVSGTIRQTGCTTAGTLSANVSGDIICTPSSQNFKNNIVSIDTGLSTLLSLRPVSYNFNPDMNMGTGLHYGFISEEVATINPQFATYDGAGHPYGLDTTAILATTVNAIKELDLKIQPLTSLNVEEVGSLASLIRDYLENISNGLRKVFVGEVNTKSLCVSDDTGAKTCITKSQLDALISGASGSVVNNGGGGSTPPVPDPVCTSPQTLVNGVCVDPIPETPPSDTPQAPEPAP